MTAYMASLDKLLARDDAIYYPAHGPAVDHPRRLVRGLIGHRSQREGQILRRLKAGEGHIPEMVDQMYKGIHPHLHPAAGRLVLHHLFELETGGLRPPEGRPRRHPP